MTAETIGSAEVIIEARFDDFDETVRRQLVQAARRAGADAEKALKRSGKRSGEEFSDELGKVVTRNASKSGDEAGNFFASAFRTAAARSIGTGLFRGLVASSAALLTALSPISTLLGGATAAVVALAAALATASGSAISLAGVLGSLGLAAATLKVGFTGVGDAMKAQSKAQQELAETGEISAATQEKLDAALAKLAPSAAAVVKQLSAMAPAWQAVTRNVQERLFAGVSTALANLGNRYLPILNRQLGITAGVLNQTTLGFARFLNTSTRANQIGLIFGRLNSILQTLLAPLTTVAGGFLDIFQASLPFAQQLALVLANLGRSFGAFLSQSAASGAFTRFMENAMVVAADLFRLLGNIGSIIGSVFGAGAAAGASLLDILADLTGRAAQFFNSAQGQEALANFFGLIGEAGDVLISVFTALQPLLAGIGSLFNSLQGPVETLGTALSGVIGLLAAQLGSALTKLGPVLGTLVTALAPVVEILGGALNGVIQALVPVILQIVTAFAQLVPVLTPLVSILAGVLVNSISQIAALIVQLLPVWAQLIAAVATGLQPVLLALQPVIGQIVTAFVQMVQALIPILVSLLPLIPALAQLSLAFTQLVIAMLPLITSILGSLASLLVQLAPYIAALVPPLVRVIAQFAGFVLAVTRVVAAVVRFAVQVQAKFNETRGQVISAVAAMISGIVGFFAGLPGQIAGHLTSFANKVKEGKDKAAQFFKELPGEIVSALSGLGGKLRSAASDAMDGLIGGLQSALGRVRSVASEIASAVTGPVGKLLKISSPSRVMMALGAFAGEGLAEGLLAQVRKVAAASGELASAVPKQIETAAVVTDSRVQQRQSAQAITAAVEPAMINLGALIVTGFLNALQSQEQALGTQMSKLADVFVLRILQLLQALNLPGVNTLKLPGLKDGGVVQGRGAAGTLIRAGEYGRKEAVIPLTKPKRARELMDTTGLSKLVGASGSKSRTVEVPINVAGNVVDYAALTEHIERVLQRYGFVPKLGIVTSGGAL